MSKIKVLFPIWVPEGNFCWDRKVNGVVCRHFDNEGGSPKCDMGFSIPWENNLDIGVLKPVECLELEEAE